MAEITRTNTEAVARVTSANRKITVTGLKALTIEESKELRALLRAEEKKAAAQSANGWYTFDFNRAPASTYYYAGV